jgi:hypothetical protein
MTIEGKNGMLGIRKHPEEGKSNCSQFFAPHSTETTPPADRTS